MLKAKVDFPVYIGREYFEFKAGDEVCCSDEALVKKLIETGRVIDCSGSPKQEVKVEEVEEKKIEETVEAKVEEKPERKKRSTSKKS